MPCWNCRPVLDRRFVASSLRRLSRALAGSLGLGMLLPARCVRVAVCAGIRLCKCPRPYCFRVSRLVYHGARLVWGILLTLRNRRLLLLRWRHRPRALLAIRLLCGQGMFQSWGFDVSWWFLDLVSFVVPVSRYAIAEHGVIIFSWLVAMR